MLPDTAKDRIKAVHNSNYSSCPGVVKDLAIPLYFTVYGEVHEKNEEETAVKDAKCQIRNNGENPGHFSGTDDNGFFSVDVPINEPKEIKSSMNEFVI